MSKLSSNNFGLSEVILSIILFVLMIIGISGYQITKHNQSSSATNSPSSSTSQQNPSQNTNNEVTTLVEFKDGGSTNTNSYSVKIQTDGSGVLTVNARMHTSPIKVELNTIQISAGTFNTAALKTVLDATNFNVPIPACIMSVSFGSVQSVIYNDDILTNIQCLNYKSPLAIQWSAVKDIVNKLDAKQIL